MRAAFERALRRLVEDTLGLGDKGRGGEILVKHDGIFQPLKSLSPALNKQALIDRYAELYGKRELPATWVFNDFGHMTCYFFKDLNDNHRLVGDEQIHGEFFHTTPDNEAETAQGKAVTLSESHGCVHVRPADMDAMIAKGYFKSGNQVVVYPYSQTSIPPVWKSASDGRPPFSVHFFPGASQIVIMGSPPAGIRPRNPVTNARLRRGQALGSKVVMCNKGDLARRATVARSFRGKAR